MERPTVTINGIDIFKRYKAPLAEKHSVQPPVLKTFYQDVPGADGSLDLSTVLSNHPTYERREITMEFNCENRDSAWPSIFSEILREFHGKEGKIIFADDPYYYYIGRLQVSDYRRNRQVGTFIIQTEAEPYKYEITSSLEDWLWDTFDFESGVIREYGNISINGNQTLMIPGTECWVIPEFITEGNVSVTFDGKTYELKSGTSKIYSIVIKEGDNILNFNGNGTVSVNYRGGIL